MISVSGDDLWKGGGIATGFTILAGLMRSALTGWLARKDARTLELERREKSANEKEERIASRLEESNNKLYDQLKQIQDEFSKEHAAREAATCQIDALTEQIRKDAVRIEALTQQIASQTEQIENMRQEIQSLRRKLEEKESPS